MDKKSLKRSLKTRICRKKIEYENSLLSLKEEYFNKRRKLKKDWMGYKDKYIHDMEVSLSDTTISNTRHSTPVVSNPRGDDYEVPAFIDKGGSNMGSPAIISMKQKIKDKVDPTPVPVSDKILLETKNKMKTEAQLLEETKKKEKEEDDNIMSLFFDPNEESKPEPPSNIAPVADINKRELDKVFAPKKPRIRRTPIDGTVVIKKEPVEASMTNLMSRAPRKSTATRKKPPSKPVKRRANSKTEVEDNPEEDMGGWKTLQKFEALNYAKTLCIWCCTRVDQCKCICVNGHERNDCDCQDGGFFPLPEMIESYNILKTANPDKKCRSEWDNWRKMIRDYLRTKQFDEHGRNPTPEMIQFLTECFKYFNILSSKDKTRWAKKETERPSCSLCSFKLGAGDGVKGFCLFCARTLKYGWPSAITLSNTKSTNGRKPKLIKTEDTSESTPVSPNIMELTPKEDQDPEDDLEDDYSGENPSLTSKFGFE